MYPVEIASIIVGILLLLVVVFYLILKLTDVRDSEISLVMGLVASIMAFTLIVSTTSNDAQHIKANLSHAISNLEDTLDNLRTAREYLTKDNKQPSNKLQLSDIEKVDDFLRDVDRYIVRVIDARKEIENTTRIKETRYEQAEEEKAQAP